MTRFDHLKAGIKSEPLLPSEYKYSKRVTELIRILTRIIVIN